MSGERVASVVVDVAAEATDKPFDYLVPPELEEEVAIGSRVKVPFGPRKLVGYVVGFPAERDLRHLKPILDVMDLTPPLTPELVKLARWMARVYLCPWITALQAMVPAVLKGKYRRVLRLGPGFVSEGFIAGAEETLVRALQKKGELSLKEALELEGVSRSLVRRMAEKGHLVVEERVGDRTTRKRQTWISPAQPAAVLREAAGKLPKNALRQREMLHFFIEHREDILQPALLSRLGATKSTVDRLVDKGLLHREERETYRDPFAGRSFEKTEPLSLTPAQESVFQKIVAPLREGRHRTVLLHGVTGSGKTEIYLQAITETLNQGRQAIVLVPEISLTPQMVKRFKGRFGGRVAVLHSGLSHGERYDEWRKIRTGEVQVAIGARSAVFAPFPDLGLLVIDEEHENSYKQEEQPRYHAREVARRRCAEHGAVLVMGTATPSVESYYRARVGGYDWAQLTERVHNRPFPPVEVVDLREELRSGNRSIFSRSLKEQLQACVDRGDQAVLFLNRRGFSTFVLCRECGESVECPHCDISLTYHRTNQTLRCHYCGYTRQVPRECPSCGSSHIRYFGTGTQRVEEELARTMPGLRVIRMDVDTTRRKGAHERLLTAFGKGKADVLLGTQMIAKGLDFPGVTLVGVIAADTMLHLPDFRAAERTFQLLTQVSGRAGRHDKPGRVVIQTYSPEHYSIRMAAEQKAESFYREECRLRKRLRYPPFCRLFTLLFSHPDRVKLMQAGSRAARFLAPRLPEGGELLGPVSAPIPRIKDRYRIQIIIKYNNLTDEPTGFVETLRGLKAGLKDPELRLGIDRDGVSLSAGGDG
ncbi:replication restart DNA helicase PriA [Melghirimyces profundicolus]|uniref:Replication restart protein PriA n=1 Tax=Melghirimyces profundicolus TaxID=1242148 RepID=A0A2T6BZ18_9BACL|nr:primosomal protein N' [Melghirimyces profundicolus]PTX61217.1 replication restart DNA helicase PriA [Melghirimyces profundicolus]